MPLVCEAVSCSVEEGSSKGTVGNCKGSQKEDENMESCTRVHAHTRGSAQKRHLSSSVEAIVSEPESDSDYEGGDADESSDSSKGGKVTKKTNDKGMPGQNQVGKAAQACEEDTFGLVWPPFEEKELLIIIWCWICKRRITEVCLLSLLLTFS